MNKKVKQKVNYLKYYYSKRGVIKLLFNTFAINKSSFRVAENKKDYSDYYFLKKKFSKYIQKDSIINSDPNENDNRIIWTLWLQGKEHAPAIVKACWKSIEREKPENYSLFILDESNISKYITLPEIIKEKYDSGIISRAFYSDIIRLYLLDNYGGYWIDSTVYCMNSNLFSMIADMNCQLFVYKNIGRNDDGCAISSWLIYSKKHDPIIRNTYNLLLEYVKKYDYLINYFLVHLMFTVVADEFPEEWNSVPLLDNLTPQLLSLSIFNKYDKDYFGYLSNVASFQKLNYRYSTIDKEKADTYYKYILNKELK